MCFIYLAVSYPKQCLALDGMIVNKMLKNLNGQMMKTMKMLKSIFSTRKLVRVKPN